MLARACVVVPSLLLLSWLAALARQDAAGEKDEKALQGKWRVVSMTGGGKKLKARRASLVFDGKRIKYARGKEVVEGTFTLDAGKTPKTMAFEGFEMARSGIYELNGDDLRFCFHDLRTPPRTFSATAKEDQILMVLKRVKK